MLDFVDYQVGEQHTASVIWLHGLGDSGHGFYPVAEALQMPADSGVRFIFPHAPEQAITVNGGMRMRAWYDIKSFDLDKRADEAGVRQSADLVAALIAREIAAGIDPARIILAGFSQGGVIALHLAPRLEVRLGGVMVLSTYMCAPQKLVDELCQPELDIFMAHGTVDEVVPYAAGEMAKQTLEAAGYQPQWHSYKMAHQVCMEELQDIRNWLLQTLAV
ncbi:alpha/beta hydrolase [Pseudoalteromonas fenneropenaei]|uniref:Alpha/beta hydrolase n=1 Tax=Pseudoalteromonas fenneropenaei TaxID=1737459 RepID=A0ABV7CPG1_9GAMM